MLNVKLFLKSSRLTDLLTCEEGIMVDRRKYPSYTFQTQKSCYLIHFVFEAVNQKLCRTHLPLLRGLIDGLDNRSYSSLVVDIFGVVTVDKPYSLFGFAFACPILDNIGYFRDVQEFNIVNMSLIKNE